MIKYIKLAPQLGISFFMPYILLAVIVFYLLVSGINIKTPDHVEFKNDGFWDMITIITTSN